MSGRLVRLAEKARPPLRFEFDGEALTGLDSMNESFT